jgi:hypothetical protein
MLQEINKNTNYNIDCIQLSEIASAVLKKIQRPFGTFKKVKYILYRHRRYYRDNPIYFFITTIHDEQESIELMKNLWSHKHYSTELFTIYKEENGITKVLFTNIKKPFKN